jgi:hypothetical protein
MTEAAMLAQILALFAAALAQDAPPARTVSPVTVSPQAKSPPADATVTVKTTDRDSQAIMAAWPSGIYAATQDSHVRLDCRVDAHGLAEWCQVASETPAGKGYGKVAMQMRPTFKVKPAMGPDGPIEARMTIAVEFKAQEPYGYYWVSSPDAESRSESAVTMINTPVWDAAPGFDDLARAYPAHGDGVEGYAVEHCMVLKTGALIACTTLKEAPENRGFGHAARGVTHLFRVSAGQARVRGRSAQWVDIPIRMAPPAAQKDRTVDAPLWLAGFNPQTALKLFPPEAAASGLTTGRGVVRCAVTRNGGMRACTPEAADPEGLGFSEAAVKLASTLRMNLWSQDGAPVEGGQVRVAIRLKLADAKPPPQ